MAKSLLFTEQTSVLEAAYPRSVAGSTVHPEDRLKVVYTVFRPVKRENGTETRINADKVVNLVFAHGTGMNREVWRYHINRIFQYVDQQKPEWSIGAIVTYDLVNHGDSAVLNQSKLGWNIHWRDGGRDVSKLLVELNLKGRTIGIGHSMGGHEIACSAIDTPLLYDSIIIIDPVMSVAPKEDTPAIVRWSKIFASLSKIIKDEFPDQKSYEKYFQKYSFLKKFHPEVLRDFLEAEKQVVAADGGHIIRMKSSKLQQLNCYMGAAESCYSLMADIHKLQVPTLHVWGTKATWNPVESITWLRSVVPNIQACDIEGGEHLVNCEMPDETTDEILKFVNARMALADRKYEIFVGLDRPLTAAARRQLQEEKLKERVKAHMPFAAKM